MPEGDKEMLKLLLAYATNLMSQLHDNVDEEILCMATTGPAYDPDKQFAALVTEFKERLK